MSSSRRPKKFHSRKRCRQVRTGKPNGLPFARLHRPGFQNGEMSLQFVGAATNGVGETPGQSLPSLQPLAAQDDAQRPLQPDDPRQSLRPAPRREQPQVALREAELGAGGVEEQAIVAGQRQLQTAAQAGSTDRGDAGYRQSCQASENALTLLPTCFRGGRGRHAQEFAQVGAGQEAGRLAAVEDKQREAVGGHGVEGIARDRSTAGA